MRPSQTLSVPGTPDQEAPALGEPPGGRDFLDGDWLQLGAGVAGVVEEWLRLLPGEELLGQEGGVLQAAEGQGGVEGRGGPEGGQGPGRGGRGHRQVVGAGEAGPLRPAVRHRRHRWGGGVGEGGVGVGRVGLVR